MALDFDVAPYYDDTQQNAIPNNYMRILFKPGAAVQARELTALQSILQNQISSLGGYIFQDGSPVTGGHVSLDTSVVALQLQQQFNNVDIQLTNFLVNGAPTLITDTTGQNVRAVVMATDPTQANPTVLVKYLTASTFAPGQTIQVATGVQTQAALIATNPSNPASIASISTGVFFSGGMFIDVQPQTIVVDSTTNAPNTRIGLQIEETIVSYLNDSTLLDPALGSSNYQAPGADRYQYLLVLATRSYTSTDDSAFYDLLEVTNGLITKQIDYPVFADLDKALARRTFDTSGNFTVKPFGIVTAANVANSNNYDIVVSPGKAYVKGFEFETVGTTRLSVPRALQTNTVNNFGFSTEFGSFVVTNNLHSGNISGFFDIANFANVDLHVCQTANINTTNLSTYTGTKIGVARIRDVEFLGLGQYYTYITDIQITGNTFQAAAGSTLTVTLPAAFGQLGANCFANALITVNTGGVIDTRTITTYANTTRIATLSTPLTVAATSSSNCTINYGIQDLGSITVTPAFGANAYYLQDTTKPLYACMDVAVSGQTITGNTILNDAQFNKLVFPLPQSYVAQNTIINATFNHRKNLFSQSFVSGNLAITTGSGLGTGESFPYGFTGSYLPDATANANFLVTIRNAQSGNIANGTVVNWDRNSNPGGNGIFQTDSTHVTIVLNTNNTETADILLTVQVTNAAQSAVARRTKTLVGNANNTQLVSTDSYLNGQVVLGTPNASTQYVDTANGYVWLLSNPDIPTVPGKRLTLAIPDVFNIIKIYDSGVNAPPVFANQANFIDITTRFALDTGQRDNYYDHSSLTLLPGNNPPTGQVVVMFQGYTHDTVQGFFDCDSYTAGIYNSEQIPYFNSTKFGTFTLRDCIDFRPTRTPGYTSSIASFSLTGLDLPQPDSSFQLGFQYYLPRIDKFQITKGKTFRIVQGVPNVYPAPPADSDDSMTCYVLSVPAFTANVKGIDCQYVENKRYTMRDIGALDTRITQLEYYSTLSQLESQAVNQKILYQDGVTVKGSYGVIADNFGAYSVADVSNPDMSCFMEPGSLGPQKAPFPLAFQTGAGVASGNNIYYDGGQVVCVGFTETPAVQQNSASTFESVQPFLFAQFKGLMTLAPTTDSFYSTNLVPQTTTSKPVVPTPPPEPSQPTLLYYVIEEPDLWYGGYGWNRWGYYGLYRYVYVRYGNGTYSYIPYNAGLSGYGVVHYLYNWYGVSVVSSTVKPANSAPTQLGTSIALSGGGTLTTVNGTRVVSGYGFNIIG